MDDGNHFSLKLLLAVTLGASLLLMLVHQARARQEEGVITIQAVEPKNPTVGEPLTFTVIVENDSVAQRVGVQDFLPPEVSLVSARPSQGTCDIRRDSASGRDSVGCDFGMVQSGSTAEAEIVVSPKVPGTITNTAHATAEYSPASPANSSSASVRVKPAPVAGT